MKKEKVVCSVCRTKNTFPVLKGQLMNDGEIYPEFCPDPRMIEETEIRDVIQVCECCGYTYPRIDENTDMDKKKIKSESYQFPFGKSYSDSEAAVISYRIALAAREARSERMAIRWFIYAGLLVKQEDQQKKCYKNALVLLRNRMKLPYDKMDIQILLAYLNIMRLLKMFGSVKNIGMCEKMFYSQTDRELIEVIIALADRSDSRYMTYFEMLILN